MDQRPTQLDQGAPIFSTYALNRALLYTCRILATSLLHYADHNQISYCTHLLHGTVLLSVLLAQFNYSAKNGGARDACLMHHFASSLHLPANLQLARENRAKQ